MSKLNQVRREYELNKADWALIAELIELELARLDPLADRARVTELDGVLVRVRAQLGEEVAPAFEHNAARAAELQSKWPIHGGAVELSFTDVHGHRHKVFGHNNE